MNLSTTSLLGYLGAALVMSGAAAALYPLMLIPPSPAPEFGARGLKRAQALQRSASFRLLDPLLRTLAAWLEHLPLVALRSSIQRRLVQGGEWLGLTPDEFVALNVISVGHGCVFAWLLVRHSELQGELAWTLWTLMPLCFAILPWARLSARRQARFMQINRGLPRAIDLTSLCMSAGLDFPRSLRYIVERAFPVHTPLGEELTRVLWSLDLGHTRREALEEFALRTPTEPVRDLVGAVVQSEQKGTALAEVIAVQARVQRMRRSVVAEEIAARAGALLLVPMSIIFVALLALLIGPFVIRFMAGGLM